MQSSNEIIIFLYRYQNGIIQYNNSRQTTILRSLPRGNYYSHSPNQTQWLAKRLKERVYGFLLLCKTDRVVHYANTYSESIRPILPISTSPLNSNFAVNVLENIINSSESGINSAKPGVCIDKY